MFAFFKDLTSYMLKSSDCKDYATVVTALRSRFDIMSTVLEKLSEKFPEGTFVLVWRAWVFSNPCAYEPRFRLELLISFWG